MKHVLNANQISAETVVDAIMESIAAGSPGEWAEADRLWGAPALDFTVTPMSLRAGLIAARDGRALFHHELRTRIPMPKSAEPEIEIWDGGTTPHWIDGVLTEPKYFSFFQDAPFASYNPNYRRKWRAHEMLHGAIGFFWRPDMTRFEFYLGARLNELLPVVHWYGFDEAFRPRCEHHQDQLLHRQFCWDCEAAAIPYWRGEVDKGRRRTAIEHVQRGIDQFEGEMETIRKELQTGIMTETNYGSVNAASDAVGYLKGHWNRCTAWSFGTWVERYLIPAHDYEPTVTDLSFRVDRIYRELLDGEIEAPSFEQRFLRRQVLDLLARLLVMIELHNFEQEDHFQELLDAAEPLAGSLAPDTEKVEAWMNELGERASAVGWSALMNTGFERTELGRQQVVTGLQSVSFWDLSQVYEDIDAFIDSDVFWSDGPLSVRFAGWLKSTGIEDADRMAFEALMASEPQVDVEFERFGALPEPHLTGRIRPNLTLKLANSVPGEWIGAEGVLNIAAIVVDGEVVILEMQPEHFDALENPDVNDAATQELLEVGVLVFLPNPRG